jgi:hypothetical protein
MTMASPTDGNRRNATASTRADDEVISSMTAEGKVAVATA